jgi:hypothetical protein
LERRDQRKGRLGALVPVHAVRRQAVAATAGGRVEQRGADVVGAEEPRRRTKCGGRPARIAGDVERGLAGVCHRGGFDLALGRKLDLDFAAVLDDVMLRLDSNGWGHVAEFGDTSP